MLFSVRVEISELKGGETESVGGWVVTGSVVAGGRALSAKLHVSEREGKTRREECE